MRLLRGAGWPLAPGVSRAPRGSTTSRHAHGLCAPVPRALPSPYCTYSSETLASGPDLDRLALTGLLSFRPCLGLVVLAHCVARTALVLYGAAQRHEVALDRQSTVRTAAAAAAAAAVSSLDGCGHLVVSPLPAAACRAGSLAGGGGRARRPRRRGTHRRAPAW